MTDARLTEAETIVEQLIDECNAVENSAPYRSEAHREASYRGNALRRALEAIKDCER